MANKQIQEMIDAQLADLEPRCLNLQKRIQKLRIQRNTYAPISKLPDDVLLQIFALTQTIYREDEWFREVSHICRRWRNVAINAPALWTKPRLVNHHFAMVMLERSKSADLDICIEYGTPMATIKSVLACVGRIEKLEIRLDIKLLDDTRWLMSTGGQKASHLRRLTLSCSSNEPWDSQPMFRLPTTVFSHLHLLRELDIWNIIFDWNILPLPNLVLLRLMDISFPSQVSIQQLLDTLRQMPHLENLQIPLSRSLLLSPSATETHSIIQGTLLRLRHLQLQDGDLQCVRWFLDKMKLSQLRRMLIEPPPQIRSADNNVDSGDSSQIVHTIASSIIGGNFGTFYSLDLHSLVFHLNMLDERDFDEDYDDEDPHVHFQMRDDHTAGRLFAQTSVDILLLCRPNLSCLVELKIEKFSTTVDELLRLSTVLCSVRKIEIFRGTAAALALIGTLATLPPHHPSGENQFIPFPALELIQFSVIDFAGVPAMLEALCDCLMLRYEYGFVIQELDLFECWIFAGQFARLKEIVANVKYGETIR